ncbi:MAG: Radical SAM domain protein [Candidatus Uhrbacteria bacterium GW2011_GWF2_39_13]|uniref:Radical SAM domain protein n=1 Tax=Candidatus Uhrbacteria bacterium GW2011_GWF2_39_13 TaxID=1618995 RepID=A0A0G0Q0D2_9BACT|nr:MAG: Radical SAM domain protein [Candidatus Uhrbacteria bacterium GW2011_GWF2_39_13]
MKCPFCSTSRSPGSHEKDLDTEDALNTVRQLAEMGTRIIHFSGGEPTLRKDLQEIAAHATECGMIVSMTTNGSASEAQMSRLLDIDLIRVSIDGTEIFHDEHRQTPGAYAKAINILKYLKSKGKHPQITTVYTEDSRYETLAELAETARDIGVNITLNVQGRNVNMGKSDEDGEQINKLHSEFFRKYLDVLTTLKKKFGKVITDSEPIPTIIKYGGLNIFGCRAMDIAVTIKSDGAVSLPCNGLGIISEKGVLKDIYYSDKAYEIRKMQGKYPICKGCYIKCMCSASAMLKFSGLYGIINSYIKNILK